MGLTKVTPEETAKTEKNNLAKILDSLTEAEKAFVNANFEKKTFHESTEGYLILYRFQVVGNPELQKTAKALVKKGLCHFDKSSGYTIQFVPTFYTA